jgi:hypothetical protein
MKCTDCGGAEFRAAKKKDKLVVGERTYSGEVDASKCVKCGTMFVPASALVAFERSVGAHIAEHGPIAGAELAFLRTLLTVRATELAELLSVRAEHVSRWENDRVPIDRNAWMVVGDLVRDVIAGRDDTRRRLASLARPPKAKRIRVEPARPQG